MNARAFCLFTFHEDVHRVPQDPDCCDQDEDGEDEGADGIDDDLKEKIANLKFIRICVMR
jgi:hypothetical protein